MKSPCAGRASESPFSDPGGHLRSTAGEGFRATLTRIADLVPAREVGTTDASLSGGMAEAAVATQALPIPTLTYEILHRLPEDLSHRP